MEKRPDGPKDLSTAERMATLARASGNAMKNRMKGEHETQRGSHYSVDLADAEAIVQAWPKAPREGALEMMRRYGPPNEATPTKLFWYNKRPWKRILVTSDVLLHDFPAPHSDFITQWIDYKVPVEKFAEIGTFDGSCLVDRTAGEAAARCDSEAANLITLNLMHEIASGLKSVDEARKVYAENMGAYAAGDHAPYAEKLLFEVPESGTEDTDHNEAGPMARKMAGKVKHLLTGGAEKPSH